MAFDTVQLTKIEPTLNDNDTITFGFKVEFLDGATPLKEFTVTDTDYKGADVSAKASYFIAKIQALIDGYQFEQVVYNHQKYTDLQTAIEAGISLE